MSAQASAVTVALVLVLPLTACGRPPSSTEHVASEPSATPSTAASQAADPDPRTNFLAFQACGSKGTTGCARTLAIAGEQTALIRQRIDQSPDPSRFAKVASAVAEVDQAVAQARAQACGDLTPVGNGTTTSGESSCGALADMLTIKWGGLVSALSAAKSGK